MHGVKIFDRDGHMVLPTLTKGQPTEATTEDAWSHAMAAGMPPMTAEAAARVSAAMFPAKVSG